ncbi:hypothetical protein F4808DRAFT_472027 [Astrocystis sublimbata]|nr:hypothetical protein F4808DRAFT_472027 [Astrocystis sublimbata]
MTSPDLVRSAHTDHLQFTDLSYRQHNIAKMRVTEISPGGDHIIEVKKTENGSQSASRKFRVSQSLIERLELSGPTYEVVFTEEDAASVDTMEVLLRCMQDPAACHPWYFDYKSRKEVWALLTLVYIEATYHWRQGRFPVSSHVLRKWFKRWVHQFPSFIKFNEHYNELLYPALILRHSDLFKWATQQLAYKRESCEIAEKNPLMHNKQLSKSCADMHVRKDLIRTYDMMKSDFVDMANSTSEALRSTHAGLENRLTEILDLYFKVLWEGTRLTDASIKLLFPIAKRIIGQVRIDEAINQILEVFGGITPREKRAGCFICSFLASIQEAFKGFSLHGWETPNLSIGDMQVSPFRSTCD